MAGVLVKLMESVWLSNVTVIVPLPLEVGVIEAVPTPDELNMPETRFGTVVTPVVAYS